MTHAIVRKSPFTGKVHVIEVEMTAAEYQFAEDCYRAGALIHNAFYMLTAAEREFIKTGITPEEWAAAFPQEDN
jgi:hypothetical protein